LDHTRRGRDFGLNVKPTRQEKRVERETGILIQNKEGGREKAED